MRVINDLVIKMLEYYNDFELNNYYEIAIWKFYKLYCFSCALVGHNDKDYKIKNGKVKQFLLNPTQKNYTKIKSYMKQDMIIIDQAFQILEKHREEEGYFGDLYQKGMIAISIHE